MAVQYPLAHRADCLFVLLKLLLQPLCQQTGLSFNKRLVEPVIGVFQLSRLLYQYPKLLLLF